MENLIVIIGKDSVNLDNANLYIKCIVRLKIN